MQMQHVLKIQLDNTFCEVYATNDSFWVSASDCDLAPSNT